MRDGLDRNFKALKGREDPMLSNRTAISLRFEVGYFKAFGDGHVLTVYSKQFEGYEPWTRQVSSALSRRVHPAHYIALDQDQRLQKGLETHSKREIGPRSGQKACGLPECKCCGGGQCGSSRI